MSELIVRGPRKLSVHADAPIGDLAVQTVPELRFQLSLTTAQDDVECELSATFKREPPQEGQQVVWKVEANSSSRV